MIWDEKTSWMVTFRLRQLLQFIDSRGSLVTRLVGSLSIPICGLDMLDTNSRSTSVDVQRAASDDQDAYLAGRRMMTGLGVSSRAQEITGKQRREM